MTHFLAILFMYLFWLTLSLLYKGVGEIFPKETTNIIVCIVGVIEGLIAATFWFSAKNKEIHAWRTILLAGAIVSITYGWFNLPKIYEDQLAKKAVATYLQMEGVKGMYPTPKTKEEKDWVSENELHAKIADLRWEYYNKINTKKNYWPPIISFSIGLLCLLCVLFVESIIDKIEKGGS